MLRFLLVGALLVEGCVPPVNGPTMDDRQDQANDNAYIARAALAVGLGIVIVAIAKGASADDVATALAPRCTCNTGVFGHTCPRK